MYGRKHSVCMNLRIKIDKEHVFVSARQDYDGYR